MVLLRITERCEQDEQNHGIDELRERRTYGQMKATIWAGVSGTVRMRKGQMLKVFRHLKVVIPTDSFDTLFPNSDINKIIKSLS